MVDNSRKISLGQSLLAIARQKALDHIHATGQKLPGHIVKIQGSIATIAFDVASGFNLPQVTIPLTESLYGRGGHQVGDKGYASAGSVPHGNASGLGPSGAPGLAAPGNLASLAWEALGNVQWPDTGGKRINQGPAGAVSMTLDSKNQVAALPGKIVLQANGVSVAITPQMIAQLAKLLGTFSIGGGGGGASGGGDGSNGSTGSGNMSTTQLLLAYQYIQPLTGATVAIPAGVVVTTVDPAGAIAALTVNFPASPADAQVQFLSFTYAVSTLTLGGGAFGNGSSPGAAVAGSAWTFQYQAAAGKWFVI